LRKKNFGVLDLKVGPYPFLEVTDVPVQQLAG
jgi:hypothetical protein